jgi:hypothetical protein
MMLNQNEDDLDVLTRLLHISETQKTYVTGAKPGDGLLFAENVIVPFTDEFPKDSYLYALITTKFDEEMTNDEVNQIIEELLGRTEAQEIPEAVSEEKRNGRYILNPENEGIESASTNLNTQAG